MKPDIKATVISPDGEIYCVPARVTPIAAVKLNPGAFILRNDWLKAVGAASPATMDDWYNILTLYKTKDPNGDSKADEIPYSGTINCVYSFMCAYGLEYCDFYADANGKVQYQWTQPAMKDYLAEMHKWYAEGLIDPQILTMAGDLMWGQMLDDIVGASFQAAASNCQWLDQNNTKIKTAEWLTVPPPKNVYTGQNSSLLLGDLSWGKAVVSASCKNADIAVKWIDYLYSEEGSILTSMGIKDNTYTDNNGVLSYTDAILKPDGKWWENEKKFGIDPTGVPQVIRPEYYVALFASYDPKIMDSVKPIFNYIVPSFPNVIPSDEENSILNSKLVDIQTYTTEMITKMIIGSEPLTSFDAYAAKIGELGINDVVAIKQAQYDRVK